MNHVVHKEAPIIPSWMGRAVITGIIGLLLTGYAAWGSRLSSDDLKHETRISVLEDHQKGIDQKLESMDKKLDRLLERRTSDDLSRLEPGLTDNRYRPRVR